MHAPSAAKLLALVVVGLFVFSALAVVGSTATGGVALTDARSVAPVAPLATSPSVAASTTPASVAPSTSHNAAAAMAASALAATKAAGINPHYVFPPRPSATPGQVAATRAAGHVVPLYNGTPAPLGLAYYGYSANGTGGVVPTILNTSSVQATVDAKDIQATDLYQSSPDSYGIQLNAVTTNVTLFGQGGFSFWTQNVIEYYPQAGFLVLITNVWNFSGGPLSANVFYTHGPFGHQVGTEYYYAEAVFPAVIQYPWNLTLTMTSNLTGGRDSVYFSVGFTGPSFAPSGFTDTYDYVVFNSTGGTPAGHVLPSPYTANGFNYNSLGLTNDFEVILGGPGGGSHSDLSAANANLGLSYWNGAAYVSVPSALSYGGETGETTTGASIAWSNASGGPANLSTYGVMSTGPAILHGLWNATAPEGAPTVDLTLTPANAFVFVTPVGGNPNFVIAEPQYAPTIFSADFVLSPGNYTFLTELSGYVAQTLTVDVTGSTTIADVLLPQVSPVVYTPLWAIGNAELPAISSSGLGTPVSPFTLFNNQPAAFGPLFGQYNDYGFPVFPGIFIADTTLSVEIAHAPSLTANTSQFAYPGPFLPATNSLQMWFWNVSNLSLAESTVAGGWFTQTAYFPTVFDSFNVIFYISSGNLVYNDTFASPGDGLLMFQGGALFGPTTGGGGHNTVFGTTFEQAASPGSAVGLMSYGEGLALQLAEGNDTIFNNAFGTPTTAFELPLDLYSGNPLLFSGNVWNVTPGSHPAALIDFPQFVLDTPNILGGAALGGNYWWDYGNPFNPFNGANNPTSRLPYDENATTLVAQVYGCGSYYCATYIYPGGDLAPLTNFDQFELVIFHPVGLPIGAPFGAVISPANPLLPVETISGNIGSPYPAAYFANGTYGVASLYLGQTLHTPTSFTAAAAHTGPAANMTVVLVYRTLHTYGYLSFHESGLPTGDLWTVVVVSPQVVSTSTTNFNVLLLPRGTYQFFVLNTSDGYTPRLVNGTVVVGAMTSINERFTPILYPVVVTETGLATGTHWSVQLTPFVVGHARRHTEGSTSSAISFQVPNGTYAVTVRPVHGYLMLVTGLTLGNITVNGSPVAVNVSFTPAKFSVTFTETGLPANTTWSVTFDSQTVNGTGTSISFLVPNGTYSYSIAPIVGYGETAHPLRVHVAGHPVTVFVTFRATAALPVGTAPVDLATVRA